MSIVLIPHQPISFDYREENCSNLSDQCVHYELGDKAMFQIANSADGCGVIFVIRGTGETNFPVTAISNEFITVEGLFTTVTIDFTALGLIDGCYEIGLKNICTNPSLNLISNGGFTGSDTDWSSVNPMIISVTSFDNESSFGASDGSVTFGVSGGVAPFQWSLDGINFQSSSTFTLLTAGEYTVTVIDTNGLISTDTYIVYTNADCSTFTGSTTSDLLPYTTTELIECLTSDFI